MIHHFEVVEAKAWHVGLILRRMRSEHRMAVEAHTASPHRDLRAVYDTSSFRRSWFVDGRLIGLGGMTGTLAETTAYVWLVLAEEAERYPVQIVKEARRQLAEMMRTRLELATTVLPADLAALRLAAFLGFHVSHEDAGIPATTRIKRRALIDFLGEPGPHRLTGQHGAVIAMGFH